MSGEPTLLVVNTALAAQSLALLRGDDVLAARHQVIGRGHAETLMPEIAALFADGGIARPDAILVDIGPGSFTGLRIGIAAARALGLAWGVPVTGYASLALVAAPHFAADRGLGRLVAVAEAGRGLLYVQVLDRDLRVEVPEALDAATAAARLDAALPVAGPGAARLAALSGAPLLGDAWPEARHAALLPEAARSLVPAPLYISAPDAVRP